MIERLLDSDFPARPGEQSHDPILHLRVPSVEETREPRAPPPNRQKKIGLDRVGDGKQSVGRERAELATLDLRHGLLADAGAGGDVGLSQPELQADGAKGCADMDAIHGVRMGRGTLLRLIRAGRARVRGTGAGRRRCRVAADAAQLGGRAPAAVVAEWPPARPPPMRPSWAGRRRPPWLPSGRRTAEWRGRRRGRVARPPARPSGAATERPARRDVARPVVARPRPLRAARRGTGPATRAPVVPARPQVRRRRRRPRSGVLPAAGRPAARRC